MINYLKKYRPNVEIQNNLEGIDVDKIPKFWIEIFENKDFDSKKNYVIKSFKKNHSVVLKNTIMYLVDNLIAVNLINNDNEYSIIYTIKNKLGNHVYYEGKNPKNKIVDDRLLVVWEKLPILLRDFYDNLHNGWYYYASESMGLVNTESIINLSDLEWGILEEITSPLRINLESSYSFFSNGRDRKIFFLKDSFSMISLSYSSQRNQ